MKITLEIIDTPQQFKFRVNQAICDHINPKVFTKISKLKAELSVALKRVLESSDEYKLILDDPNIIGDFGFPQGDSKRYLDAIIDTLCDSITITFVPFVAGSGRIHGSIKIGAIISDFSDVLGLSEAVITYFSRRFNHLVDLDWLDWLLTKGNKIIIKDFHIEYGGAGRSGEAVMKFDGTWRVDPAISGTTNNNWITRAVGPTSNIEQELNAALEQFFIRIV